ncbi:hypothetical protein [Streptomyces sp. NPDC047315]|uniref:hypothetical protein n=1 Tax=Streptomyces sp. NPDC047315 TaxID=3155142 RepID=UPI0033C4E415
MFGLLSTLAEIISAYTTRFLDGRGATRDVDVAARLFRIVMMLQDLAVQGERLLGRVEGRLDLLEAAAEVPPAADSATVTDAESAQDVVELLDGQLQALDELASLLEESRPLLTTVDVGLYRELAPLLDEKSGLVTRWRQQASQSRFSTTTLFFLPSDTVRSLVRAGQEADGPRSLDFVSAVGDALGEAREHELRDVRELTDGGLAAVRAAADRLRGEIRAARGDLAAAVALCERLHMSMEPALGAEAMAGLRRTLLPNPRA